MKKILKLTGNFIAGILTVGLVLYLASMHFFPEQLKELLGYQTFVILTDSMEPTIPVGSLVVVKNLEENENIPEDEIISFRVNRLGEEAVFTHYFKKKELDETGKERYYTMAENADRYDDYKTYREDILGTYICHVPYAGKIVLFLQSPFALLELGLICIFLLIYHILWNKFDREEKALLETTASGCENDLALAGAEETQEDAAKKVEEGIAGCTGMIEDAAAVREALCEEAQEEAQEELREEVQEELPSVSPDILFGYHLTPSSGAFENEVNGFSVTIEMDGTVHYERPTAGKEEAAVSFVLSQKSVKKIKKIIKENAPLIRSLPDTLDNGFCVGSGSFFNFKGREIGAWNIKHNNLKKIKSKDHAYYKKYKKNLERENDLLDIFGKIRNVLKEEGIRLRLDSLEVKAAEKKIRKQIKKYGKKY